MPGVDLDELYDASYRHLVAQIYATEGTVKSRLSRARGRLAGLLDEDEGGREVVHHV